MAKIAKRIAAGRDDCIPAAAGRGKARSQVEVVLQHGDADAAALARAIASL